MSVTPIAVASESEVRVPRRRMQRPQREAQLLDAAEDLFISRGWSETRIEDIAQAAGVTRPIVYEHFGSKEGVYLACVRRARRAFEAAIADAYDPADDPHEQMRRGADVYFGFLQKDRRRWELLFARTGLVADELAEALSDERFVTVSQIAAMYQAVAPHVDPTLIEAIAHAVSGSAEQLGRWWLRHPRLSRAEVVDIHVALVWPAFEPYVLEAQRLRALERLTPAAV